MRIVADRNIARAAEAFAAFGEVELVEGRTLQRAALARAEILLVRSVTRVDAALLEGTPVRWVGTATAGLDHVDRAYLARAGIGFASAPSCNARPVAEYVLACLLLRCLELDRAPSALTLGIVGHGHAGSAVAALAGRFGVRCLLNDPPRAATAPAPYVALESALAADVVSLHVPLEEAGAHPTRNLLGARELGMMRPDALLVNAARGGVVDEAAWRAWIGAGRRAVVDCWCGEPRVDPALLACAWLATPHVAGHTIDARERATAMLRERFAAEHGAAAPWSAAADAAPRWLDLAPGAAEAPWQTAARAVLACCDPRAQTAAFRASQAGPPEERSRAFDALRTRLGRRREFARHAVASVGSGSDTGRLLSELGFSLAS